MKFPKTTLAVFLIIGSVCCTTLASASTTTSSSTKGSSSSAIDVEPSSCTRTSRSLIHDDDSNSSSSSSSNSDVEPPFVDAKLFKDGQVVTDIDDTPLADVYGCCEIRTTAATTNGEDDVDASCDEETTSLSPVVIGSMPQFSRDQTMQVLESAKQAWKGGMGVWTQMSLKQRIHHVQQFLKELQNSRTEIINVLMWEIGKNYKDAAQEFDRTIEFAHNVIRVISSSEEYDASWQTIGTTKAFVRRAAIGIIMCLGPYNYPLNETYATLIPALLMGNVVIMKIPTVGGLAHLLTMDAFAKTLPKGTIQFVSGGGRATMPPLMADGSIDGLAFIGGSAAADNLIKQHPHPHRLKLFLQLEAKNMGIFLKDLFVQEDKKEQTTTTLESALDEAVLGSLSYNGQRCTALKMLFVPKENAKDFTTKLVKRVESLPIGLPWQTTKDGSTYSQITPLPNHKRVSYMKSLIDDALSKGASIMNQNGGSIIGGSASTLMVPAVLYPVTSTMKVYHEEQFGPVIPIVPYDTMDEIVKYGRDSEYGQQCSIFTSDGNNANVAASLVDQFSSVFGKININSQCGRSPDTLPFSGRRSSAMGVMSVSDALREFSVPTVVAYKDKGTNGDIVQNIQKTSNFMEPL
mmetsp:Transcript_23948/g.36998  ORF Transcript_23948/g.36998 Transcript_23948/m.36998 type:complete len:632 (-) Transcript_23948:169-2064(-)